MLADLIRIWGISFRSQRSSNLLAPEVEAFEPRKLFSGVILPAQGQLILPRGEYPAGTIRGLGSKPAGKSNVEKNDLSSGNYPASVGPTAQVDTGTSGLLVMFPYMEGFGLSSSSPSSADVDVSSNGARVKGSLDVSTDQATSVLQGGANLTFESGPNDDSGNWASANGNFDVHYGSGMVLSYFALLGPLTNFSSSASGAGDNVDSVGNGWHSNHGLSGAVGLPLSSSNGTDTFSFSGYAAENPDGVQSTALYIGFEYYTPVSNPAPGDIDGDGDVDAKDVTFQAIGSNASKDLNGDNSVNTGDLVYLVNTILNSRLGDFNLDGVVNASDNAILQANLGRRGSYAQGDANGDLVVNSSDYAIMQGNYGWTR